MYNYGYTFPWYSGTTINYTKDNGTVTCTDGPPVSIDMNGVISNNDITVTRDLAGTPVGQ